MSSKLNRVLVLAAFTASAFAQPKSLAVLRPPALQFVPFSTGLPVSGQWREGFRIADMNGDGHLDIVHGPARKRSGPPVIFLGDGKGSWTLWKEAQFPDLDYDYGDIEVADFNGDGQMDIALAVHLHGIFVLTGDGHGKFSSASARPESAKGFSTRAIRVTDWNGDGRPDLVAMSEGPGPGSSTSLRSRDGAVLFLNQGTAGWLKSEPALSKGIFSDALTLGDFNGDGRLDVATGSSVMGRKDLVNLWRADGAASALTLELSGSSQYVQAIASGDFDNDGKDDLVVAYLTLENDIWYSTLDLFYARADGKWERRALSREASREGPVALATGHLRGRGMRDLVGLTTRGETFVYLSDGHGGLARSSVSIPVYGGGCRGSHVELADLDGDGRDEIIAAFADEPATFGGATDRCSSGGGITAWKAVVERQ